MSVSEDVIVRPLTGLAWTSNSSTCPKNFTLISTTEDGVTANFTRGFGLRSGYHLCYIKDMSSKMVLTDVQVITDKESIPHGYCYIAEHLDSKNSISKKKRVCVRQAPVGSADTAVLDLKLTAKSKMMLQHYTYVGDINGYVLWCRKGPFTGPVPQAKPRSVSLELRQLSLDEPSPLYPLRPNTGSSLVAPSAQGRISQRRCSLNIESSSSSSNSHKQSEGSLQGPTALDGVPFSLSQGFDIPTNDPLTFQINNIRIKSVTDIEKEYNYTFTVEESAAKRIRPSLLSAQ